MHLLPSDLPPCGFNNLPPCSDYEQPQSPLLLALLIAGIVVVVLAAVAVVALLLVRRSRKARQPVAAGAAGGFPMSSGGYPMAAGGYPMTAGGYPIGPHPEGGPEVPAGWFPDPSGRFQSRYWDGAGWTDNVNDGMRTLRDPPG